MVVQLVVATGHRAGQIIPITGEKFIIGRAGDCHLKSQSELISRYHCAVLVGDDVVVRDLGSKQGVRLNNEKINAEQKLKNGDKLVVGPLEFYVHIAPAEGENAVNLSADGQTDSNAAWSSQPTDSKGESGSTTLLDQLKSLNQGSDVATEMGQPIVDFLKKFH